MSILKPRLEEPESDCSGMQDPQFTRLLLFQGVCCCSCFVLFLPFLCRERVRDWIWTWDLRQLMWLDFQLKIPNSRNKQTANTSALYYNATLHNTARSSELSLLTVQTSTSSTLDQIWTLHTANAIRFPPHSLPLHRRHRDIRAWVTLWLDEVMKPKLSLYNWSPWLESSWGNGIFGYVKAQ